MRKRSGATGKLATVGYLTARIGCSRQTALSISKEADFPRPIDILNDGGQRPMAVWWRKEVDRWLEENPDPVRKRTPKEQP